MKYVRPIAFFALLFAILSSAGCKRTACFTIENEGFLHPRYPIQFRNCSERADEYEWDFGDGETSTEAEPTHSYYDAGTYEIKLTATHGGSTRTATKTITLNIAVATITVMSFSPTKPNGDPWDPDGSGTDIKVTARGAGDAPWTTVFATHRFENVVAPFQFPGEYPISYEDVWVLVSEYNNPTVTDYDTMGAAFRYYEDFVDSTAETIDCWGQVTLRFEIH